MLAAVGQRLVDTQRTAQSPTVVTGVMVTIVGDSPRSRGRAKELPPPDDRFQQKLSEVAEAPKSGGSSKKWRKLQEKAGRKITSKCE